MDKQALLRSLIDEAAEQAHTCLLCAEFIQSGEYLRCRMFTKHRGRPLSAVTEDYAADCRNKAKRCRYFRSLI